MTDITIRALCAQTAALLDNVAGEVFDHPIRPDQLQAFLADPAHHMFVATSGGRVVGMISAVVYLHPDKPPNLWINEVGVGARWRRLGIGTRLMTAMLDHAKSLGCEEIWLGTEPHNKAALALYRKIAPTSEDGAVIFTWNAARS